MDALECLKTRRVVREFTTNDIPKEIIEDIIDCARLAPTARNTQPWEFVVVTENEKLRQLAKVTEYGGFIANASACVVVCCQDTKYYLEDGSAATENILLAAKAHDIGSCWIAGDKKPHCEDIKKLLGIPENMKVVSIVPLGYPERKMLPVGKRDLKDVLHWEKF